MTEIAEMTGEKDSTVRSRLFYGKKKLLKLIGGGENEKIYRFNEAYLSDGGTEK